MTEHSAFHNGYQLGDSQYYDDDIFAEIMFKLHLGNGGYVVPTGSFQELEVTFSAGQDLSVAAGSAFVGGVYYNNSAALTVSLENNATSNPRIDRIVVQVSWTAQTARIIAKRGSASATPIAPTIQQDIGTLFEIPLAYVYIPAGFAGFGDEYIFDERQYLIKPNQDFYTKNIMFNSEFLTAESPSIVPNIPYPMWESSTAVCTHVNAEDTPKFDLQSRGRAVEISCTPANDFFTSLYANNGTSLPITIAFIIHVTSAFAGSPLLFSIDGGATTKNKIPVTGEPIVIIARSSVGAVAGQTIDPHFSSTTAVSFKLGQMVIAIGNNPPPFLPNNEFVLQPYKYKVAQSATGDSGLERKVYDPNDLWPGIQNAFMVLEAHDSNTAADVIYTSVVGNYSGALVNALRAEIGRLPISTVAAYKHGMVGLDLQYNTTDGSALYYWAQYMYIQKNAVPTWNLYAVGIQT